MQTIVRNCPQLWAQPPAGAVDHEERWFSPTELALAHGWPLVVQLYNERVTWMIDPAAYGLPQRKGLDKSHIVGNGMSFQHLGSALLWYHAFNVDLERNRPENSKFLSELLAGL